MLKKEILFKRLQRIVEKYNKYFEQLNSKLIWV